jgi:hypothetical protein
MGWVDRKSKGKGVGYTERGCMGNGAERKGKRRG